MVRIGALDMLDSAPPNQPWPLGRRRCSSDPVRGVRIRAAALLAGVPEAQLAGRDRERFERAAAEFVAAQRINADRPEARTTLGSFYRAASGRTAEAEAEYKAALRSSPQFPPAAVNLADLYRQPAATPRAKPCCAGARRVAARRGAAPRARPGADTH